MVSGSRVPEEQAVLTLRERLHLWQVWMLLEWQWQVRMCSSRENNTMKPDVGRVCLGTDSCIFNLTFFVWLMYFFTPVLLSGNPTYGTETTKMFPTQRSLLLNTYTSFSYPPHQCGDDRLIQQLLPDVRPRPEAGRDLGGVPGKQQAHAGPQAPQGVCRRQAQEGWNQRGQFGLQQEDPPHGLAPAGQHHRSGHDQQPLHIPG